MDTIFEIKQRAEGVELGQLEPLTTLLVFTWHSTYRLTVTQGSEVIVQGGAYFPEPTRAYVDGASAGGGPLMAGWIGVGLSVEFRANGKRILTSPVVAIATEEPVNSAVS